MKYYEINFPGESGQHVTEIWSEEQILNAFYRHWCAKMIQNNPGSSLDRSDCIDDWCSDHWAVEIEPPAWAGKISSTLYDERYDAEYDPNTNEWLEDKCGDPDCYMCSDRPARPL